MELSISAQKRVLTRRVSDAESWTRPDPLHPKYDYSKRSHRRKRFFVFAAKLTRCCAHHTDAQVKLTEILASMHRTDAR